MSDLEMVDYAKVAAHIRAMEPRALTADNIHDVLTLVEWMQKELCTRDEELNKKRLQYIADEAALRQRERELAVKARSVGIAITIAGKAPRTLVSRLLRR